MTIRAQVMVGGIVQVYVWHDVVDIQETVHAIEFLGADGEILGAVGAHHLISYREDQNEDSQRN
jgi:hypothetical protein